MNLLISKSITYIYMHRYIFTRWASHSFINMAWLGDTQPSKKKSRPHCGRGHGRSDFKGKGKSNASRLDRVFPIFMGCAKCAGNKIDNPCQR